MATFTDRIVDDEAVLEVDIVDQNGLLLQQHVRAVIDTGASMTVLQPCTAMQCGIPRYPSQTHPEENEEWCDFSFRHPVLGEFQVTALCRNLNHAHQPPILIGQPELRQMILTYDGVNAEFKLDRP